MSQLSFSDAEYAGKRKKTRREVFLEEMEITIRIDNGDARVFVREIFANHVGGIQEGNYVFALPSRATISWVTIRASRIGRKVQSRLRPYFAPVLL